MIFSFIHLLTFIPTHLPSSSHIIPTLHPHIFTPTPSFPLTHSHIPSPSLPPFPHLTFYFYTIFDFYLYHHFSHYPTQVSHSHCISLFTYTHMHLSSYLCHFTYSIPCLLHTPATHNHVLLQSTMPPFASTPLVSIKYTIFCTNFSIIVILIVLLVYYTHFNGFTFQYLCHITGNYFTQPN